MPITTLPPTERTDILASPSRLWQDVEEALASSEVSTPQSQPESEATVLASPNMLTRVAEGVQAFGASVAMVFAVPAPLAAHSDVFIAYAEGLPVRQAPAPRCCEDDPRY